MANEDVPPLMDLCSDGAGEDNYDSDGWDEMESADEQTTCLFCSLHFRTIAVAMDHCRTVHNFDLLDLKTKYAMDVYSFIKMINYIRKHKPSAKSLLLHETAPWNDDSYLKPNETESWLMFDFDDLGSAPSTPHYAIDGKTPISTITYADLQRQIHDLSLELQQKEMLLEHAVADINRMKEITRNIVEHGDQNFKPPNCVAHVPVGNDSEYFNSYSHYDIHLEMLSDKVRTVSYRDAILKNGGTFEKKLVLDVGCGTSILSMFAAKAGALKVYGIDQSDVVFKAMDIVRLNNLENTVELIHGRLEDTQLPVDKVDIIISEWMGYFLLFEGMLDSVIYARDTHLKPGGVILPNRCNIQITACSHKERYDQIINFWDDVYGFKMSCMKSDVICEAVIEVVPADSIVATSAVLTEIDIMKCTTLAPEFKAPFELEILQDCTVTGLVGYFDTFFDLEVPIMFSTGSLSDATHWKQTVFYLRKTLDVHKGDTLKGTLTCKRKLSNVRGLSVTIEIAGDKYDYNID